MRKQNSTFKTDFLSEAGSELENNDYFAFVELDKYACYVIADGLNNLPDADSARLATQTILLAFQEHPSMKKRAVRSYLKAANQALAEADSRSRLKASVTVAVTDYAKVRYGYAGNTRLRLYRNGAVEEQTFDTSLGTDILKKLDLTEDALARHEERNNLYSYLGQGKGFCPQISDRIRLKDGDILTLYTRGVWENLDGGELDDVFSEAKDDPQESLNLVEDLLLSRQPAKLENYTFAAVFVDKVYLDPNRKRRIKKIILICVAVLIVLIILAAVLWFLTKRHREQMEELERRYTGMIEYIQDANFIRAEEECGEALALAEKLRRKEEIGDLADYQKLIEAVNAAEELFGDQNYQEAQSAYVTARERSRYADRIADEYIEKRLGIITDYLSVFDYIQLGDTLTAQGDYDRAEEKYLQARKLATGTYFEEGRKEAMDALENLYASRNEAEEESRQEAQEQAENEAGAVQLAADGDRAFAKGDYSSADAYYAMALEKYQEMGDDVHAGLIRTKISSSGQKGQEAEEKKQQAEAYMEAAEAREAEGNRLEAKKQYLFAKSIYRELKMDEEVDRIDGLLELLETGMEQEEAAVTPAE